MATETAEMCNMDDRCEDTRHVMTCHLCHNCHLCHLYPFEHICTLCHVAAVAVTLHAAKKQVQAALPIALLPQGPPAPRTVKTRQNSALQSI